MFITHVIVNTSPPEGPTENFTQFLLNFNFFNPIFMVWEDFLTIPHTI